MIHGRFGAVERLNLKYALTPLPCQSHGDKYFKINGFVCHFVLVILFVTIWCKNNKLIIYLSNRLIMYPFILSISYSSHSFRYQSNNLIFHTTLIYIPKVYWSGFCSNVLLPTRGKKKIEKKKKKKKKKSGIIVIFLQNIRTINSFSVYLDSGNTDGWNYCRIHFQIYTSVLKVCSLFRYQWCNSLILCNSYP